MCVCVCVCVCACVCLCGRNNFPRLLVAASDSACRIYIYDKLKVFDVWILLKTYGSKVIVRNTFQDAFVDTERTGG